MAKRVFLYYNVWRCFLAFSFALAGSVAAQEAKATLLYSAESTNAVSITANTTLLFVGETAGSLTVIVFGVTGILTGEDFVPDSSNATGTLLVTLNALSSCDITDGCSGFGLENFNDAAHDRNTRASVFAEMSLPTLSMFIASGANINMTGSAGTALHYAVREQNTVAISVLLAAGIDATITDENNRTPWHLAIFLSAPPGISRIEEFRALIDNNAADINHAEAPYGTPLRYAVDFLSDSTRIPFFLLLRDNGGHT